MQKNPYKIFNNYILRTPLFPLDVFKNLTEGINIDYNKLDSILNLPAFREAIYLASPDLFEIMNKWTAGLVNDSKKEKRLKISILKYITRMSSRSTPFGLFASCSLGQFSSNTNIKLNEYTKYKRRTQLDMAFIDSLFKNLSGNININKKLKFKANNSLYYVYNQYRYITYSLENNTRVYHLEGISITPYLNTILKETKNGKTANDLASLLTTDNVSFIEAMNYIKELIKNQVIVSEFEPTITSSNNLSQIIALLEQRFFKEFENEIKKLKSIRLQLDEIDKSFINSPHIYTNLKNKIKDLKSPLNTKSFLKVDSITSTESNFLDIRIKRQIKEAMLILNKISIASEGERMAKFKQQFKKRFEYKEVPLCIALDPEMGLDYDVKRNDISPILDNLKLSSSKKKYRNLIFSDVDSFLLKKVLSAIKKKEQIIKLVDDDFKDYANQWSDLPDTMSAIIEVMTIDNKTQIFCDSIGGSSGANLISRFGYMDKAINEHINNISFIEEQMNPDKIIAEIIHLPQASLGNILNRSVQREYEIPYLGKSYLPKEQQIKVTDILISLKDNTFFLRSKKLNKEILPRLTSAHVSDINSLPIYRFLLDIQKLNNREGIEFVWNDLFNSFYFLPRVVYKNIIFSKAKWLINKSDIKHFYTCKNKEFNQWSRDIKLPQYVQLVEGDNTLLINTKNQDSIEILLQTVKNKNNFILEEFLFNNDKTVSRQNETFCNQIVVSFFNNEKLKSVI